MSQTARAAMSLGVALALSAPGWAASPNARFAISWLDGQFTARLIGRLNLDVATYDQDPPRALLVDDRRGSVGASNSETLSARDLSGGPSVRRAHLGAEGRLPGDLSYRVSFDLSSAGKEAPSRLREAWISYSGLGPTFQIGAFAPPANLDDATASDDSMFLERASPSELSRSLAGGNGRYAFGARANGEDWLLSLHITGGALRDGDPIDRQAGFVGRAVWLAASGDEYHVHLGANLSLVTDVADMGADQSVRHPIRLRDRPELRVDSTRLIDTGKIDASGAYAAGIEFAANWKGVTVQAEHFWYGVDRRDPLLADPRFDGWYAQAAWLVTGGARRYSMARGAFGWPAASDSSSAEGIGALELSVRFSRTDLNFREGESMAPGGAESVRGGQQDIWTFGATWFAEADARILLNYQIVDVERLNPSRPGDPEPFGPPPETPPIGVDIGQSYEVLSLRAQLSF